MRVLFLGLVAVLLMARSHAAPKTPVQSASASDQLAQAIRVNDLNTALRWVRRGADVDTRAEDGRTVLMLAAAKGNVAALQKLKSLGAKVNLQDNRGRTALMHCSPDYRTVLFLLKAGADPSIKDAQGNDFTRYFNRATTKRREVMREEDRTIWLFQRDAPPLVPVPTEIQPLVP